ncbi:MAG: hypothetical protein AAF206_10530 [Bacteroidota bacterium]
MKHILTSLCIVCFVSTSFGQNKKLKYFYKEGIPNLKTEWTYDDLSTTLEKLNAMLELEHISLPVYGEPSYKILQKISQKAILDPEETLSISEELSLGLKTQQAWSQLMNRYLSQAKVEDEKLNYGREVLQLFACSLHLVESLNDIVAAFIRENPDLTEIQKAGLVQMQSGMVKVLNGSVKTILEEYSLYPDSSICEFSAVFFPFLNKYIGDIDEETKVNIKDKMNAGKETHPMECVRELIAK